MFDVSSSSSPSPTPWVGSSIPLTGLIVHLAILLKKNDGNSVPSLGVSGTIFKKKSSLSSDILSWNVLTSIVLDVWPPVNPNTPLTSS